MPSMIQPTIRIDVRALDGMRGLSDTAGECQTAYNNWQSFDRLAKKTGDPKYDKQRPDAVSNAAYWQGVYQNCVSQQQAQQLQQAIVSTQVATQSASTQFVNPATGAVVPAGTPGAVPVASGMSWGTIALYGGLIVGGSLLVAKFMGGRGGKKGAKKRAR